MKPLGIEWAKEAKLVRHHVEPPVRGAFDVPYRRFVDGAWVDAVYTEEDRKRHEEATKGWRRRG